MKIIRWLYLSGLVFAVLIPAGWQMGLKDLANASRYGHQWRWPRAQTAAVGAAQLCCRLRHERSRLRGSLAIKMCLILSYLSGQAPS